MESVYHGNATSQTALGLISAVSWKEGRGRWEEGGGEVHQQSLLQARAVIFICLHMESAAQGVRDQLRGRVLQR